MGETVHHTTQESRPAKTKPTDEERQEWWRLHAQEDGEPSRLITQSCDTLFMGCNDPQHKEQFLAWLKARIEEGGDSIEKPPSELLAAYHSGNPKDLDASMWREWYDHFNPGWKEETVAAGGFTTPLSGHPENRVRFLAWLATKVKDWGYEMQTAPYGMREAFESGSPEKLDPTVLHMWEDEFYGRITNPQLELVVKLGPRGGRYTEDVTREGRAYRRYF